MIDVPSVNLPVRCVISVAKDKMPECPLHLNFHGGGFIYVQDHDDDIYCAHIAAQTHGVVIDVDYATAYEHPFPVPFEQSYEVARWAFAHLADYGVSEKKVSVGGSSAGGCLAAAVALKASLSGDFKFCLQVYEYAANDNYLPIPEKLDRSIAFSMFYADGDEELLKDPYVSPAYMTDEMLPLLPKTLIISAENCPFTKANEKLGARLVEAGVEVHQKRFKNSNHGFVVRISGEWESAQQMIIDEINRTALA